MDVRPTHARQLVHSVGIFALTIPLAAHYFRLETQSTFILGNFSFSRALSFGFVAVLTLLVAANIWALHRFGYNRSTALITGGFLFVVAVVQATRWAAGFPMFIIGHPWTRGASMREAVLVLSLATIVLGGALRTDTARNGFQFPILPSRIIKAAHSAPPYIAALLGLGTAAFIGIPLAMLLLAWSRSALAPLFKAHDILTLAWIGVVGAQGSVVSALMRLNRIPPGAFWVQYANAAFKPFIGMTFAHLSYCVLRAVDQIPDHRLIWVAVATAFVSGFSERFARDLVASAEALAHFAGIHVHHKPIHKAPTSPDAATQAVPSQ